MNELNLYDILTVLLPSVFTALTVVYTNNKNARKEAADRAAEGATITHKISNLEKRQDDHEKSNSNTHALLFETQKRQGERIAALEGRQGNGTST